MSGGCKGRVWNGWHTVPCYRGATKDGYCKTHHPDAVAQRQAKRDAKLAAKLKAYELNRMRQQAALAVLEAAKEWSDTRIDGPLMDAIEAWRDMEEKRDE